MWWQRRGDQPPTQGALPSARALRRGVQVMTTRWQATATRQCDGHIELKVTPAAEPGLPWSAALAVITLALAPHAAVVVGAELFGLTSLTEPRQMAFHGAVALLRVVAPPLLLGALGRLPGGGDRLRYHAAEHQVMAAFEAGRPLTLAEVRAHPRFHRRCGSAMALRAAVLASLGQLGLGATVVAATAMSPGADQVLLAALELGLVAGAMALALRWHDQAGPAKGSKWIAAPGRIAQGLITQPASDAHLQTALAALRGALLGPDAPGSGSEMVL